MLLRDVSLLAVPLALLLAACGSAPKRLPSMEPTQDERAAQLNIELAAGYIESGEYEIALERLRRAERLDPRSAEVQTLLGILHEEIRRPEQAARHYERSIQLAPDQGAILNNYGAWLCRSGRPAESYAWFRKALDDPFYRTPQAALYNAGACALDAGDTAQAEEYLRRVVELDPTNAQVLYQLAVLQVAKGDFMRARAFIQRRESVGNVDPQTLELAARIETALGDRAAADRYNARLRSQFPEYRPSTPEQPGTP